MGYIRNECIVVSSWSVERLSEAHAAASGIFNSHRIGSLVSGVTLHIANGGGAFMIAPDGSKEGWEASDTAEKARSEFIYYLNHEKQKELYLDWALIELGGDDRSFTVLKSAGAS